MINESELIEFFDGEYGQESSADEIKKAVKDELKSYAKNINVSPKAIMSAYNLYKKYKGGKQTNEDLNDLNLLNGIIDEYFSTGGDLD